MHLKIFLLLKIAGKSIYHYHYNLEHENFLFFWKNESEILQHFEKAVNQILKRVIDKVFLKKFKKIGLCDGR